MRQYKGLTKDIRWIYGWYLRVGGEHYIVPDTGYKAGNPHCPLSLLMNFTVVLSETVGQSTDSKDKNGKDCYFNDVVKWNNKLWVVVRSKTLSSIELQPLDNYREQQKDPKIKRLYGTCFGIGQASRSEVIGDIYQNPELLK